MDSAKSSKYLDMAEYIIETINKQHLPIEINHTTLLRVIHVQMYVKLRLEYRVQVGLAQTNCSEHSENQACTPQPYAPTVLAEAMVYVEPWFGAKFVIAITIKVHDCTAPLQSEPTPLRDCREIWDIY